MHLDSERYYIFLGDVNDFFYCDETNALYMLLPVFVRQRDTMHYICVSLHHRSIVFNVPKQRNCQESASVPLKGCSTIKGRMEKRKKYKQVIELGISV